MTYKTVGIVGGIGPAATALFYSKLIKNTNAKSDKDHLPVVIVSFPPPDVNKALINNENSPVVYLNDVIRRLHAAGAEFVIIACNTIHGFLDKLQKPPIPIINMVEHTTIHIKKHYPNIRKVGILGTSATIKKELYQKELEKVGLIPIVIDPESDLQDCVMKAIYGVYVGCDNDEKKGEDASKEEKKVLTVACDSLLKKGAQVIILGCTEIPLVVKQEDFPIPLVDPMDVISKIAVKISKNEESTECGLFEQNLLQLQKVPESPQSIETFKKNWAQKINNLKWDLGVAPELLEEGTEWETKLNSKKNIAEVDKYVKKILKNIYQLVNKEMPIDLQEFNEKIEISPK